MATRRRPQLTDSLGRFSRDGKGELSMEDRFWPKVARGAESDCWLWIGSRDLRGYGRLTLTSNGKRTCLLAHRVSVTLSGRDIPPSMEVMHTCDVPSCVNPSHLIVATHLENMRDAFRKGIVAHVRCTNQRLTDADVRAIRSSTDGTRVLSQRYHVTPQHIRSIRRGLRREAA